MNIKTYHIWQVSAQTLLANAVRQPDGRYAIRFNFENAQHNDVVQKTEQSQCAMFDQIEKILETPEMQNRLGGLRKVEWHIIYVDFAGIFDREPIGKARELQEKAESMFRPEGITLNFPYSNWRYIAFERSASMSRVSRLTFVSEHIYEQLTERITLGMRFDKCVLSKVYAYNGLMFTDGYRYGPYFRPDRVIVVDDFTSVVKDVPMITVKDVGGDGAVREYERIETVGEVTVKEFDGEGLICTELAGRIDWMFWKRDLHSSFQIRMPYIKGVVHAVDFHALFRELNVPYIVDAWGNRHDPDRVELILTKSMFKAFGWMTENGLTWREYLNRCEQYGHALYISQVNPVVQQPYVDLNYQFLATISMTADEFRPADLPDGWTCDPATDEREWLTKESEAEYYRLTADPKSRLEYFTSALDDPGIDPQQRGFVLPNLLKKNPAFIHESVFTEELKNRASAVARDLARGHMLILGENRYLSGDLMRFLLRLVSLTESCEDAIAMLEKECLSGSDIYAPRLSFPIPEQVILLRNPHIARNEEAVVNVLSTEGRLRKKYLSHLSHVVMVDARTLVPERLGGADFDGDIVKLIADPLLNRCVLRNYSDRDSLQYDYRRNLPLLKIPSVSAKESDAGDWHARFETVRDTFATRVGQICNAAFNRAVIAYNETLSEEDRTQYREETELLAILTGLEIDAAKNGVKPDLSAYIRNDAIPRSTFLDYKDLIEGKRGKRKKGRRLYGYYKSIRWEDVTSNIERLPYLAEQIKRNTPKCKATPASDRELFAFASDPAWEERLPKDAVASMAQLISDYETALRRIRTERLNLNCMTRKRDVERILFSRAQEHIGVELLYAAFAEIPPEEFHNARAALREQSWHLIRDPYQRNIMIFELFSKILPSDIRSILMDFRCGGYRILGDIVCDYDDFYRKRGVGKNRLRREDDCEDLRTLLDGDELLYRSNFRAELKRRCRICIDRKVPDHDLALRCAIALGKRKFALDVLDMETLDNALERKTDD